MKSRGAARTLTAVLLGAWLAAVAAHAGTTGKISGRATDQNGQALVGVNVAIPAARVGAVTDDEGYYSILQVPPGTWVVRASLIGHQSVTVNNVLVASDKTTKLDLRLVEAAVEMKEVIVTARRPVVETNLTSTRAILSKEQIEALPVQELQDVVNLQAGVVDGHFRGGRSGEVQFQVNGVTVNNPFNNASTLRLDRSLLQEVQVISGTFDAEYGQAMSGVVNAVLRSGSDQLEWSAEALTGDFFYPGSDGRRADWNARPGSVQNYQLTVSGPMPLPRTFFMASGRHYRFQDHLWGERRFVPTDRSDFETKQFFPTGDGEEVPLSWTHEWSGLGKLANRSLPDMDFSYEAIFNVIDGQSAGYNWRFNPDGRSKRRTFSIVHGGDFTHRLSKESFYSLVVRHNYLDYRDMAFESLYDPGYDAAGPPRGDGVYELGAVVQGVDPTRYKQKTSALVLKGSYVNQFRRDHLVKAGAEFQRVHVFFGSPGYLVSTGDVFTRHVDEPPDYPGVLQYVPHVGAAYAQDEMEWNDLTLRAGARLDWFDARATVPGDLRNPANAIDSVAAVPPEATTAKVSLAPRLGLSYPVGDRAAVFFAYGHFYQMPALGQVFANADYGVLTELQIGQSGRYGVLGNPDIRPERTVQYEFGYKQALAPDLGFDATVFYKDIRDLLGVEFISTYTTAEYARFTNVDFGSVKGFTIALDQRPRGLFSGSLDYTWQLAQGNASDPRETATRAAAGEDPRPRQVPLGWDQRHTLNVTLTLSRPNQFALSAIGRLASGQPYTPSIEAGFGGGLETNSGRKPSAFTIDLRGERKLSMAGLDLSLFGRVFNLLDTRFFNGFVFANSGSPDYSRSPTTDEAALADPGRFFAPRRIEIGVTMNGRSS